MTQTQTHVCPECGKPMILKPTQKNFCAPSAEYTDAPCPGDEPTTQTPIAGAETEILELWYCPQCTVND